MKGKISESFQKMKSRLAAVKWKEVFTGRGAIALGSLLMICAIVAAVAILGGDPDPLPSGNEESTKTLGQSVLVGLETSEPEVEDYFVFATENRERTREEAIAVLQLIADNPDVLPDTKDEALAGIGRIANEMSVEANIETLIKAKGIEDCIAIFSEGKCTVIVRTDGLLDEEKAQILDIVVTEASVLPENVKMIEASA